MHSIMLPAFLALGGTWHGIVTAYGPVDLVDLKMEVGWRIDNGKIVIVDVIDKDSWRIWPGGDPGRQLDKLVLQGGSSPEPGGRKLRHSGGRDSVVRSVKY